MKGRKENKYVIPMEQMDALRQDIAPYTIPDNHRALQTSNVYEIRSIYYDSLDLKDYYEKHAGLQMRKKLRIRGYNTWGPDCEVFLEIKWKDNLYISKDRVPVKFEHVPDLLSGGDLDRYFPYRKDFPAAREKASRFLFHLKRSSRVPINLVTYTREAYIGKFNHSDRVTFDSNIRSMMYPGIADLYEDEKLKTFLKTEFVLEWKSEHPTPRWFKRLILKYDLKKQAFSKYVRGIDTHYRHIGDCSRQEVISLYHF